jgi:hypothetical protein
LGPASSMLPRDSASSRSWGLALIISIFTIVPHEGSGLLGSRQEIPFLWRSTLSY